MNKGFRHLLVEWPRALRLTVLGLARQPGFSLTVVLSYGVSIGVAAAVLAVFYSVLLRPLPVTDQDHLVVLTKEDRERGTTNLPASFQEFQRWREQSASATDMAGVGWGQLGRWWLRTGDDQWREVTIGLVTTGFFRVLGVQPAVGRFFELEDEAPGAGITVVVSHQFFRTVLGADSTRIGSTLPFRRGNYRVVGVTPPAFRYPEESDVWITLSEDRLAGGAIGFEVVARLAAGVTPERAHAELQGIVRRTLAENPDIGNDAADLIMVPMVDAIVGRVRATLVILLLGVALLFFIAGSNVAYLLFVRNETRRSQLWIRQALGATRLRLIGLVTLEAALLAAGSAVVGWLTAATTMSLLAWVTPQTLPRVSGESLDAALRWSVMGFAVLAWGMLAMGSSIGPWFLDAVGPMHARSNSPGPKRVLALHVMVCAQVATATFLMMGAGLVVHTFVNLQQIERGYDNRDLLVANVPLLPAQYQGDWAAAAMFDRMVERVEAIPAVRSATQVLTRPFSERGYDIVVQSDAQTPEDAASNPWANLEVAAESYFDVLGIRLVSGRAFLPSDRGRAESGADPSVFPPWEAMLDGGSVIVDEALANFLWPGQNALGRRLRLLVGESWLTVVGVAESVRYRDAVEVKPTIYLPLGRAPFLPVGLVLRTAGAPADVSPLVRQAIRELDGDVPLREIMSFEQLVARELDRPRLAMALLSVIAGVSLLIAAVGTYSIFRTLVQHRTRELAIRVALGATPHDVFRLAVEGAAMVGSVGIGVGLVTGLIGSRALGSILFEVRPLDPFTLLGVGALLAVVIGAASAIPARRAARLNAVEVLAGD